MRLTTCRLHLWLYKRYHLPKITCICQLQQHLVQLHNLSKLGKEFHEFICQFKLCHQIQFTMQDKKAHLLLCSQGNTNIPSFRAEGNPPTKIFFVLKSFKGAAPLGIVLLISTCILRVNEISNYIQKCFLCLLYLFYYMFS